MQINIKRDKSFADDLIKGRGIVSGRVALLLRSAEIKPLFYRFVPTGTTCTLWYVVRNTNKTTLQKIFFFFYFLLYKKIFFFYFLGLEIYIYFMRFFEIQP